MSDMLKNLESHASSDAINRSKLKMNKIKNPPEFEDGMGAESFDDFDFSSLGGDTDSTDDSLKIFGSTPEGSTQGVGQPFSPFFNQVQQQPQTSPEDDAWDFIKTVLKTIWSGLKKAFKYLTTRTLDQWVKILSRSLIVECVCCGLSLLLLLFGVKSMLIMRTTTFLIFTVAVGGVNIIAFSFVADYKIKCKNNVDEPVEANGTGLDDFGDEFEDEFEDEDDVYEQGVLDATSGDSDLDFSTFDSMYVNTETNGASDNEIDDLIEAIKSNKNSDRNTLFEVYSKILPRFTPDFDERKPITEENNANLFHIINSYCTDAIHATTGRKFEDDEDTYLMEAFQTKFYILAKMKRIQGVSNLQAISKEVESFFKNDYDEECYATVETMGSAYVIKVYTMENVMISIGDLLRHKGVIEKIKEEEMLLPVILGVTDMGKPVVRDFALLESFIVAGMPRSGKTWVLLSILSQLAMFNSPEDVQFIILDPKSSLSDYKYLDYPHVLCWCGDTKLFLKIMRDLVDREFNARKELIGKYGCASIFDFNRQNPDLKLPVIYLVLEEVVTFSSALSKEEKEEFDDIMVKLASTLPSSGIRMMLVPHVVKNQFLSKTVKDVVPFRASVRGNEEHIKNVLEVKNFKRTLINRGDMAVRINTEPPVFIKSAVITDSSENNKKVYSTVKRIWDSKGYKLRVSPALIRAYEIGEENRQ